MLSLWFNEPWFTGLSLIILIPLILLIILPLNFYLPQKNAYEEKLSPYECGMNPLGSAREKFSVQFILVGILFLVFDLEILFLFPFLVSFYYISFYGYWIVITFLIILTIGLVYELSSGVLSAKKDS